MTPRTSAEQSMGHNEHHGGVDILEGDVANKLCFNDGTNVCELGMQVVHVADGRAHGDGGLDLARVLLGYTVTQS